jgi:uncharacterized membrane protein
MNHLLSAASATPSPSGTGIDEDLVTPGPWGFAVMAVLGIIVVLLVIDMLRRIRRARYRSEVREDLDAEEAAARQAEDAARDSEIDDQDIDPDTDSRDTGPHPRR